MSAALDHPELDFQATERRVADTSLQAYDRILPTLTRRQVTVFLALCDYLESSGQADVTGGELTEFMKARHQAKDVNGCRPRLTEMQQAGWVESGKARRCRAYGSAAHPYWPAVPRAAIARLREARR